VSIDRPCDSEGGIRIAMPSDTGRQDQEVRGSRDVSGGPSCDVRRRGEDVSLVVVAPPVRQDHVFDHVDAASNHRDEVVELRCLGRVTFTVETPAGLPIGHCVPKGLGRDQPRRTE